MKFLDSKYEPTGSVGKHAKRLLFLGGLFEGELGPEHSLETGLLGVVEGRVEDFERAEKLALLSLFEEVFGLGQEVFLALDSLGPSLTRMSHFEEKGMAVLRALFQGKSRVSMLFGREHLLLAQLLFLLLVIGNVLAEITRSFVVEFVLSPHLRALYS